MVVPFLLCMSYRVYETRLSKKRAIYYDLSDFGETTMKYFILLLVSSLVLSGCVDMTTTDAQKDKKLNMADKIDPNITPSPFPTNLLGDQTISPSPKTNSLNRQDTADHPQKPESLPTQATVSTAKGEIVMNLFPDDAPQSITNLANKAESGFYEGLTFHRVEDWVIQGGDPKGNGTGGGNQPTEFSSRAFKEGSVGIARGGNRAISNDAQFFICTSDCSWLTGDYTLIGEVVEGMDVAKQIEVGDTIQSVTTR